MSNIAAKAFNNTYVSVAASGVIFPRRCLLPAVTLSRKLPASASGASARTNSVDSHSLAMEKYQNGMTAQYIQSGASGCADHAMNTTPWNDATKLYPSCMAYFPSLEALKICISGP